MIIDNNDPRAPWNEEERYIEVTVSMTISKSVAVKADKDTNLDSYTLKELVENQISLPTDLDNTWIIDDFVVNLD